MARGPIAPDRTIEFRLLGPLEALADGERLPLGPPQQRSLLILLLLHANEVVSRDRLIEELWSGEPPATAPKLVQLYVSALRKALEPGRAPGAPHRILLTRPPGYVLEVEPEAVDLARFERLRADAAGALAQDDAAGARDRLNEALALWRGEPLADVAYEPYAQAEIARLAELRLATLEDRIEADLRLGRHAALVGELGAVAGQHPLRERLRAAHMLALYRSGRQAEALAAYQDARRALVDELGIEPGRALRDLEQAVLRQDPDLEAPARGEPGPGRSQSAFVGRERELAELSGALDDALAGRGRVVLVAGEPGIGKSRLAEELMRRAESRAALTLAGRCWEAGGAPPYWPWVQPLRAYIRDAEPGQVRAQLGPGAAELAQILPEIRELIPALPEAAPDSEGARFRLFEAAADFLRRAAHARPLVLALDDLHAADQPSLLLLRFVAREIAGSRVLLLCTFRDVDPTMREPLAGTLAELAREPQTTQVILAGLSADDVGRYFELSTGTAPAARLVTAVHAETGGNPLFVAEVVRLLESEGEAADPEAHLRIPPGVRAVIGRRIARLSPPCQRLLTPASVLGREFGLDAVARLSGLPQDAVLDLLDEAMAERVVGDVPGSPGRLRFGHALIRDTLYDELTPARRLQLHRAAGEALEAVYAADLTPHLGELARHFAAAAPAGTAGQALEYARRAGDQARAQLAYEEAARLYSMALALVTDGAARCELLVALGDAQARSGDTPASRRSLLDAADLAERLGLAELLARAALGYGGRLLWQASRDDDDHLALLERALAGLGDDDSSLRVRLLARAAGGPLRDARFAPERRHALAREALAMARRLGDPDTLAYALSGYIAAHHSPDFTHEQAGLSTELVRLATEAGDLERAAEGLEHRATARIELGDVEAGRVDLAAMAGLAGRLRQPSHDWFVGVYAASMALLAGELDEAEILIEDARRLGERALSWSATVAHGLQLYVLRREQGRLAEVEGMVRQAVADYTTYPIWRCALAQATAELGRVDEARAELQALASDGFAALTFDEEWLVSMGLLAEAAAALGDAEVAAGLYPLLLPYADRIAFVYPEVSTGAVARPLGLLAATLERWDDAAGHFQAALAIHQRIGAHSWLARMQADYDRMLAARRLATGGAQPGA